MHVSSGHTEHLCSFLADLYERLVPGKEREQVRQNLEHSGTALNAVVFHHLVQSQAVFETEGSCLATVIDIGFEQPSRQLAAMCHNERKYYVS